MYSFDTSSIIHAWDNYPISNNHFSSLWEDWIAEETKKEIFVIPKIAFEEIHEKSKLRGWLKEKNIKKLPMTREILNKAMEIKNSLGIEEKYGKNGVNGNDILIIVLSTAVPAIFFFIKICKKGKTAYAGKNFLKGQRRI